MNRVSRPTIASALWVAAMMLASTAQPARADAPGVEPRPVTHARPPVPTRATLRVPVHGARLLPPCDDGIVLLLRCRPRLERPVGPQDVDLLNDIATLRPARHRPYRQLFSWD